MQAKIQLKKNVLHDCTLKIKNQHFLQFITIITGYFQKVFHAPVNAISKLPVCDDSKNAWGVEMHFLLPLS